MKALSIINRKSQIFERLEARLQSKMGLVYGLLSNILSCMVGLLTKKIPQIPSSQILVFRSLFIIFANYTLMTHYDIKIYSDDNKINKQLNFRGFIGFIGNLLWFCGIMLLPLSEGTTLVLTCPIITGILARIFLKESYGLCQVVTTLLSFIGILLVTKPTFLFNQDANFDINYIEYKYKDIGAIFCLLCAFFQASVSVMIRSLGSKCHTFTISHYNGFYGGIFSPLCLILFQGVKSVSFMEFIIIFGISIVGWAKQITFTRSCLFEKASKVAVLQYTQIIGSLIIDYFAFNFVPDIISIFGMLLVGSSIFSIWNNKK